MKLPPVAACLILKDAEHSVARALDSVRSIVSEVVVVLDDATTDRTEAVVARYGARVTRKAWTGFADARNLSFQLARAPWLLVIDGDEELTQKGDIRHRIVEADASPDVDGIAVRVETIVGGSRRAGEAGDQIRVVRNTPRIRWKFAIHNQLRGYRAGSILRSTASLDAHYPESYDSRWERNEGRLLSYRAGFTPDTEEWRHATVFLARGASCIGDHAATLRYAREICEESPEGAHASAWALWVRSLAVLGAPRERIAEVIDAAIAVQPQNVDVLWWRMQQNFSRDALAWARAAQAPENHAVDCWSAKFVDALPEAAQKIGITFVRSGNPE